MHKVQTFPGSTACCCPWWTSLQWLSQVDCLINARTLQKCWSWGFVHLLLPYVMLFGDYFSCFLSKLIRWFVVFMLHCFSLFGLFVVLKFLSPVSLLFGLWHWAQGLYYVAFPLNLVSDTRHKSALLWFILTKNRLNPWWSSAMLLSPPLSFPHWTSAMLKFSQMPSLILWSLHCITGHPEWFSVALNHCHHSQTTQMRSPDLCPIFPQPHHLYLPTCALWSTARSMVRDSN